MFEKIVSVYVKQSVYVKEQRKWQRMNWKIRNLVVIYGNDGECRCSGEYQYERA